MSESNIGIETENDVRVTYNIIEISQDCVILVGKFVGTIRGGEQKTETISGEFPYLADLFRSDWRANCTSVAGRIDNGGDSNSPDFNNGYTLRSSIRNEQVGQIGDLVTFRLVLLGEAEHDLMARDGIFNCIVYQ